MENGEQKTCQVEMLDGKPCGRPLFDGEKCICHSEKEDKDIELFQKELDKIFADEKAEFYDLTGFIFPKEGYELPREYKKDTFFSSATFSGDADFRFAKFLGYADFSVATFSGDAGFVGATFSGNVNFSVAMFPKNADFRVATFSGYADFGSAMFSKNADFRVATFSGYADFGSAMFSGAASFIGAKFSGAIGFQSTFFKKRVDFLHCKASKGSVVTFDGEGLQEKKKEMFPAGAGFIRCSFAEPKNVTFRKVSLEKCEFLESDVTEVQFVDVTWTSKPKFFKWFSRDAVYDELSEKPDYKLIARLYRRLQKNYMDNLQYAEAGDFYIGEQEMMRKAKGKVGQYLSTNFLYKIISYYGESFLLPLFWLAFVLVLIPAVLLYDGVNLNPTLQDPVVAETVNYEWSWSPGGFCQPRVTIGRLSLPISP